MTAGPPEIFDRAAYRARRARAKGGDLFLVETAADQVRARLGAINRTFKCGLDLSGRAEFFPLVQQFAESWVRTRYPIPADSISDPHCHGRQKRAIQAVGGFNRGADAPRMDGPVEPGHDTAGEKSLCLGTKGTSAVVADEETLPFPDESFDLVLSVLALHAVNDLPGTLVQIRRILKPDGLFLAALFGGETLRELRLAFAAAEAETLGGASPRVSPFADVRDLGGLLQRAGFALPVADVERSTVRYRDLSRLFSDLRAMGETNVLTGRRNSFLSRRTLAALTQEYASRFADSEGRVLATFDIVFLTGWAPHESQQKALKPGSAKTRLADALGTVERPAGERPRR